MKTIQDIIDEGFYDNDELYLHLLIEFENNAKHSSTRYQYIREAKGMPNGIREDSGYLFSLISKNVASNSPISLNVDLQKLKMGFIFGRLELKYEPSKSLYGELNHKDVFSKELVLTVHANKSHSFLDIENTICHELLHAHAYILSGYDENGDANFNKRLKKISYDSLFDSKNAIEQFAKAIIYASNEDEVNAFILQMTLEIEQQKPRNPEESLRLLKQNAMYNSYCNARDNLPSVAQSKEFCDVWRRLVKGQSSMPDRKIILNLRRRFDNIQKRLNRIIPKICYENRKPAIIPIDEPHFYGKLKEQSKNCHENY